MRFQRYILFLTLHTHTRQNDPMRKESNARLIRWSDGSLMLQLGEQLYDGSEQGLAKTCHLFVTRPEIKGLEVRMCFYLCGGWFCQV